MPKQQKIEPMTPITFTWVDAQGGGAGSHSTLKEVFDTYKPCVRRTTAYFVGYATKDGERALLTATDDDRTPESPEACGGIIQTPAAMIRKIEIIGAKKQRSR